MCSIAEGGCREAASGLWVAERVRVRVGKLRSSQHAPLMILSGLGLGSGFGSGLASERKLLGMRVGPGGSDDVRANVRVRSITGVSAACVLIAGWFCGASSIISRNSCAAVLLVNSNSSRSSTLRWCMRNSRRACSSSRLRLRLKLRLRLRLRLIGLGSGFGASMVPGPD